MYEVPISDSLMKNHRYILRKITFQNEDMLILSKPYIIHSRGTSRRNREKTFAINFSSSGHVFLAVSVCGKRDHYSRKMGRMIAEGRLRKLIEVNKNNIHLQNPSCGGYAVELSTLEKGFDIGNKPFISNNVRGVRIVCSIPPDVMQYMQVLQGRFDTLLDEDMLCDSIMQDTPSRER